MTRFRNLLAIVVASLLISASGAYAQINPGAHLFGILAVGNSTTVTNSAGHWSATGTLTPGAVGAAAKVATTMTFPAASFVQAGGYVANCSASGSSGAAAVSPGIIAINAFVATATTVTVEFVNGSAGSITPASQLYRCDVWLNTP